MCCNILWHAEDVKLLGGPGVKDEKVRYGHGYRNDYPGYGGANVGTSGYSGGDGYRGGYGGYEGGVGGYLGHGFGGGGAGYLGGRFGGRGGGYHAVDAVGTKMEMAVYMFVKLL
jgi:hypothetical protein